MAIQMNSTHPTTQLHSHFSLFERSKSLFLAWLERARTRRELAELPPYLLKDIGLTEADRYIETNKPFWRD